jgi:predicted metal-dependent enzyme (double-stranded beta helix superfamily)
MTLTFEQKRLVRSTNQLEKISERPTELALRQAASFLTHLVKDPDFLESLILPLLEEARSTGEWYVAHRQDGVDGVYSLQVFVWPAGTRTQIHDHSSWGPTAAPSSVLEERYERLDDCSRPDHARLKKAW